MVAIVRGVGAPASPPEARDKNGVAGRFREVASTLDLAPLAGKTLACHCTLHERCPADELLRLANASGSGAIAGVGSVAAKTEGQLSR